MKSSAFTVQTPTWVQELDVSLRYRGGNRCARLAVVVLHSWLWTWHRGRFHRGARTHFVRRVLVTPAILFPALGLLLLCRALVRRLVRQELQIVNLLRLKVLLLRMVTTLSLQGKWSVSFPWYHFLKKPLTGSETKRATRNFAQSFFFTNGRSFHFLALAFTGN